MQLTDTAKKPAFRDLPVDILRGLAITLMVGANLVPVLLDPPAPLWLRVVASLAAPLFIFLSGMMVPLSCRAKNHDLWYFVQKGCLVIAIAALLDLAALFDLPFMNFDVLYLIGFSLPLVYLYMTLPARVRWPVIPAILAAAPVLRVLAGYSGRLLEAPLPSLLAGAPLPAFADIVSQWLVCGWFPVIPWLAIALAGAEAGRFRWQGGSVVPFDRRDIAIASGALLAAGTAAWILAPGPALVRNGYVELFYPPTTAFLVAVTGAILCLFMVADRLPVAAPPFDPLRAMGECSLAIYILHILVIAWLIAPLGIQAPLPAFLAGYLLLLCTVLLAAYGIRRLRGILVHPPFVVRILIGG